MDLRHLTTNEPFLPRTSYTLHDALLAFTRALGKQPYTDRALRKACNEGRIPHAKKVGKTWHIPASYVQRECKKLSELAEPILEQTHVTS